MPDRYGDNDDTLTPYERAEIRAIAADQCDLCDDNGYRNGTVCDHIDHTAAAIRGMAMIRATMGWHLERTESDETTKDGTGTPNTPKREPEAQ